MPMKTLTWEFHIVLSTEPCRRHLSHSGIHLWESQLWHLRICFVTRDLSVRCQINFYLSQSPPNVWLSMKPCFLPVSNAFHRLRTWQATFFCFVSSKILSNLVHRALASSFLQRSHRSSCTSGFLYPILISPEHFQWAQAELHFAVQKDPHVSSWCCQNKSKNSLLTDALWGKFHEVTSLESTKDSHSIVSYLPQNGNLQVRESFTWAETVSEGGPEASIFLRTPAQARSLS